MRRDVAPWSADDWRVVLPPEALIVDGSGASGATKDHWQALGHTVVQLDGVANGKPLPAGHLLYVDDSGARDILENLALASRWLAPGGVLVMAVRLALRRAGPASALLPLLDHVLALAGRCGFEVKAQRETGAIAECADLLMRLERALCPRWLPCPIGPDNAAEMQALFLSVFGQRMTEKHWQWKYGDGRGYSVAIAATEGPEAGKLVAHYGGISRRVVMRGVPLLASQSCDVMVSDAGRGSLARRGPLFLAAATFLERQVGFGTPHHLAFGFPSQTAWKLPHKLGLYGGPVGRMLEIGWRVGRTRPALRSKLRPVDFSDTTHRAELTACWERMRHDAREQVIGLRDADYLQWRYADHPERHYHLRFVRRRLTSRAIGVVIVGECRDGVCELLDLAGAFDDMPELVAAARRLAASLGAQSLFMWASETLPPLLGPVDSIDDLGVNIPGNTWTPGIPLEEVQGRWWLTGGDTDFH